MMACCKYRRTGSSSYAGDGDYSTYSSVFAAGEMEVAGILLRLPNLVKKSESSRRFPASWGAKRKRSAVNTTASNSPPQATVTAIFAAKLEDVSSSPISPLAFPSPPDSDSKLLRTKNKISASHQGELLEQCERLTNVKEMLQKEFKKVEAYRDGLMAENAVLHQRMSEVHQRNKKDEQASLAQSQPLISLPHPNNQRPALIVFPRPEVGPTGIPDLNVPPPPPEQPPAAELEYYHQWAARAESRAAAAWARRNRSLIQKAKNSQRGTRVSRS